MKKTLLLLSILFCMSSFAQENQNNLDNVIIENDGTEVPFSIIEEVPVHSDCIKTKGNRALKDCMSKSINRLMGRKFNTDLANDLNLPAGRVRIIVSFRINREGLIDNIKARAPHPVLEQEAKRVINLIPKFTKPGIQRGKPVSVSYMLPIVFIVEDTSPPLQESIPLTKKELKALKKAQKKAAKKLKKLEKKLKKETKKRAKAN